MAKKLILIIAIVTGAYLGLELFGYSDYARLVRPLVVPLLLLLYIAYRKVKQSRYLFGFLIMYSISELLEYVLDYLPNDVIYFGGNSLYILSYIFLILEVCSNINRKAFLKTHIFHSTILLIFAIFCVNYLTGLANLEFGFQLLIELLYNIVLMLMISLAMLNFFSRPTNKSMYLLLGVFCLVFSEILIVANLYIEAKIVFSNTYSIMFIIGMFFIFKQACLEHQEFKFLEPKVNPS